MPRLLLVDENPSIRRSAEILLGGTDVELVALASAEEALAEITSGGVFDVALVHAFLPGSMDGWGLLAHLRSHPATARLPIALMAGVLKEVDPVQIAEAPIQGFLRKPIELGNLRERLTTIMAAPVAEPAPFRSPVKETLPGTPLDSFLPETRAEEPPMERDDDILILEVEDLFPGEAVPVALDAMPGDDLDLEAVGGQDSLELEELDLEALRILEPVAPAEPHAEVAEWSEPTPPETPHIPDPPATWEEVPPPIAEPEPIQASAPEPSAFLADLETSEGTVDLPDLGSELDLGSDAPAWETPAALVAAAALATIPVMALQPEPTPEPIPEPKLELPAAEAPASLREFPATVEAPSAPSALPAPSGDARGLVQALIADPAALDALCRAVVAELGDRALREIAWEIMPDLAKKLPK